MAVRKTKTFANATSSEPSECEGDACIPQSYNHIQSHSCDVSAALLCKTERFLLHHLLDLELARASLE